MKKIYSVSTLIAFTMSLGSHSFAASTPLPPTSLLNLLNETSRGPYNHYFSDAKILQQISKEQEQKKNQAANAKLKKLIHSDTFADIALLELAKEELQEKHFLAAQAHLENLLREYSFSPWIDVANELLLEANAQAAVALANRAHTKEEKRKALKENYRILTKLPWKDWDEQEGNVKAVVELSHALKDPLEGAYTSEALLALPLDSNYRQSLVQKIGTEEAKRLTNTAKYRPNPSPLGVKTIAPDQQLMDSGMEKVLAENWSDALDDFQKILNEYSSSEQIDRAKFWAAVCMEENGDKEKAKQKFQEIFSENPLSYYGMLAADKLKTDLKILIKTTQAQPITPLAGRLLPRQQLYLWRAIAFLETDQPTYSSKELEALYNFRPQGTIFGQENPQQSLQLAALFFKGNYFPGAFLHTSNALGQDHSLINKDTLSLLFPKAYLKEAENAAKDTGLDLYLILSVIKQESGFRANVTSRADAMGLMQLLQSTGRELSPELKKKDLFAPEKNIKLGSLYLKKLVDRFGGSVPLALAAYNAGPTRVAQWQKKLSESALMKKGFRVDAFIDSIPFQETRKYVGNILRNQRFYSVSDN